MRSPRHVLGALLLLVAATTPARALTDPAAPCTAAKLDASGQALTRRIRCEAGRTANPSAAARRACRARTERRRRRAFTAAEAAGGCLLSGDRRGRAILEATAYDLVTPDRAAFVAARVAAQTRFEADLATALAKGDCAEAADPAALARVTDTFVETLRAMLLPPLRTLTAATGRRIGAAVQSGYLANEPDYVETLVREFNAVTAEFEALWVVLHPARGVYDFAALDAIADFAEAHDMLLPGHHLVWDLYFPDYLHALTPEELRAELEEHIRTVAGRYRGRMGTWVVVNEAANLFSGGFRPGLWIDTLGPGYIADAFRIAHESDPDAELIYNDVFAEGIGPKSDFIYALVQDLLAQGVPIHGVGFQMHQFFDDPLPATFRDNLQRFADLGLRAQLTEMDVLTDVFPGDLAARLEQQRHVYHDAVAVCLAVEGARR